MKKYILIGSFVLGALLLASSCKDYLDVVPDNVATIDNAFATRAQAEKYLYTCYSYMPKHGAVNLNPAINGGDEIWRPKNFGGPMLNIAQGLQSMVNPYGGFYWSDLYAAIRDCNIFLENIDKVRDIEETEKIQWIAEVKFLKAYYHFYLVRMYGPIPLIKENLPISADVNEVKVTRDPVDDCFNYITELLDEATEDLPVVIADPSRLGRITQAIALSLKAKVLVTAASPLFNGNTEQSGLVNHDGTILFNVDYAKEKWDLAAAACKAAIDACHEAGISLYYYQSQYPQYDLSDTIITQMNIRNSVTDKWNSEIIWANTQSNTNELQRRAQAHVDPIALGNFNIDGHLSPPLKIAEMFYSKNGVPINEDVTWDYSERFSLRTAEEEEGLYVLENYTSASLNFDREPRFYANLGFDGGVWYGHGKYNDKADLFHIEAKRGQFQGKTSDRFGSVTGYWVKKLVHYENVMGVTEYSINSYPWPIMRLADLYLLYAEALNESQGPGADVYQYINLVRERAGLESVEASWTNFSINPSKHMSQEGLREIIRQERLIELAFEGQRFWDLRRWKETAILNGSIRGWNLAQERAVDYYKPVSIFNQEFGLKDYFWPIDLDEVTRNPNLVQNIGW